MTAKFGVGPASIADYLALVGDSADGYPGPRRLGCQERCDRARQVRLDRPRSRRRRATGGSPALRGAEKLAVTLRDNFELALLFRRIATVEVDVAGRRGRRLASGQGPTDGFAAVADRLGAPHLVERAAARWRATERHPPSEVTARLPAAHERYR